MSSDAVASIPPPPPPPRTRAAPAHDDDDVLVQIAGGSTDAFAELYDRFAHEVYGLAKRVVRDAAMAEEVAHEALLDVWLHSAAFDRSRGTARGWVLTIVHRRAVDAVRTEQASRDRLAGDRVRSWRAEYDSVSETALRNLTGARVRDALEQLTPLQRQSVHLAYFGGFTHREIAGLLEVPVGTAKSRISSGLRSLRTVLVDDRLTLSDG